MDKKDQERQVSVKGLVEGGPADRVRGSAWVWGWEATDLKGGCEGAQLCWVRILDEKKQ